VLSKTLAFTSIWYWAEAYVFTKVFIDNQRAGQFTETDFCEFFVRAKSQLGDNPFGSERYGSSEGEAGRIARTIISAYEKANIEGTGDLTFCRKPEV